MRIAFKMKIKPGCGIEYKKRHDEIWPELTTLLKYKGLSDFTIFLDEDTDLLFAVQQVEGASSQELGQEEIVKKWWAYMSDIMYVNEDNSPETIFLKEVFYLK
jgi:L-rhamnose mutarotase